MSPVRINRSLQIPDDEIELSFSTSSGPGGQHANKAATRVELAWNVARSRALGPRQRERLLENLAGRIDSSGTVRLRSERHRSQVRNREDVLARLAEIVGEGLRVRKERLPTSPSPPARERRLVEKRRRSEIKRARRTVPDE